MDRKYQPNDVVICDCGCGLPCVLLDDDEEYWLAAVRESNPDRWVVSTGIGAKRLHPDPEPIWTDFVRAQLMGEITD